MLQLSIVGGLSAEHLCMIEAEEESTVAFAKAAIEGTLGMPLLSQRLVATSSGRLLVDDELLSDIIGREGTLVSLVRANPQWCQLLSDLRSGRVELEDVDATWREDRDLVLAAVRTDGCALEWAGDALRCDREVVLTAVCESGSALRHAGEHLQDDREVVMTAVQSFGLALEHASAALRGDPEVALVAVQRDLAALAHTAAELKINREFALAVVQSDGSALRHFPDEMKRDSVIVLAAVRDHPSALLWAGMELQGDSDFVLAAVQANGVALRYAVQEMRRDPRVVLAAMSQNTQALWYGSAELKNNERFTLAVQEVLRLTQEQEQRLSTAHEGAADAAFRGAREALLHRLLTELNAAPAQPSAGRGGGQEGATPVAGYGQPQSLVAALHRGQWPPACKDGERKKPLGPQDGLELVELAEQDVPGMLKRLHDAEGLRSLVILKCEAVTAASWVQIFNAVPSSVEMINAQRCNLDDVVVTELGRLFASGRFPELVTLWLLSNEVTDSGAVAVGVGLSEGRCPRLREVWLYDNISDAGKARVNTLLPQIDVEFNDLGLADEDEADPEAGTEATAAA